jgi:hypothetical protein
VVVLGAAEDVVEEDVDVAALAIAVPVPATSAVAARLAIRGLMRFMFVHLLTVACQS